MSREKSIRPINISGAFLEFDLAETRWDEMPSAYDLWGDTTGAQNFSTPRHTFYDPRRHPTPPSLKSSILADL